MTYKVTFLLNRIGIKSDDSYIDRMDVYLDSTETINVAILKESLRKLSEIRRIEAEQFVDMLYLITVIEEVLNVEFEDKPDFEFPISKGNVGTGATFDAITIVINQLTIIEINENVK